MKIYLAVLWLIPLVLSAQTSNNPPMLTEDRVRVLVNEQTQVIEARLAELQKQKLETYKQDFEQRAASVEQKLTSFYIIGAIIATLIAGGFLAVFIGAVRFAKRYAEKRIKEEVDLAIYKLDPRWWKIRIPRLNFDSERERLIALKFRDLEYCDGLNENCKEGITIYRATSDQDLQRLKEFMVEEKVDPMKCCFVIYYTEQPRLNTQLLAPFDNFIVANMPSTLSSQIFAASRNIVYGD
jgi:hypothetical protein